MCGCLRTHVRVTVHAGDVVSFACRVPHYMSSLVGLLQYLLREGSTVGTPSCMHRVGACMRTPAVHVRSAYLRPSSASVLCPASCTSCSCSCLPLPALSVAACEAGLHPPPSQRCRRCSGGAQVRAAGGPGCMMVMMMMIMLLVRFLEPSWSHLGPSCGHLGPSWGVLGHRGAILSYLGAILGPSWGEQPDVGG